MDSAITRRASPLADGPAAVVSPTSLHDPVIAGTPLSLRLRDLERAKALIERAMAGVDDRFSLAVVHDVLDACKQELHAQAKGGR